MSNWAEFLRIRRDVIEEFRQEGKSCTEIARILSMDAAQVYLISRVEQGDIPEDARIALQEDTNRVRRMTKLMEEGKL